MDIYSGNSRYDDEVVIYRSSGKDVLPMKSAKFVTLMDSIVIVSPGWAGKCTTAAVDNYYYDKASYLFSALPQRNILALL